MFNVVGISGSLRPGSYTNQIIKLANEEIEDLGAQGTLLDLRPLNLPFCDGSQGYPNFPDVETLRARVYSADALLLSTPEYHGSMSGVLKNTLDLLEAAGLRGKVAGLIAVLGGRHSSHALDGLRTICRQVGIWATPKQLIITQSHEAFDENGQLKRNEDKKRLKELVTQLVGAGRQFRKDVHPEKIF